MDNEIKDLLTEGNDPLCHYAANRIGELEKEIKRLKGNDTGITDGYLSEFP